MSFVRKNFVKVYLLLLVFDVKPVVNDAEKLESCATKIANSLIEANEDERNLLKLIDQSTVILKAFCSENLINFVEEGDEDEELKKYPSNVGSDDNNIDDDDDDYYGDYYFYKGNVDGKLKTLMTFTPITIFKGTSILRQLESFNNQEFFLIRGQLNATLELSIQEKILYQKKCFGNSKINDQHQELNENHLVERRIRHFVPGQLIVFGKLHKNSDKSENRLVVKTNGIVQWKPSVENFVWNNLGWSNWGKWSPCSKSCKVGIQQRHRHCLTNQQNTTGEELPTSESKVYEMDKFESATTTQHSNQQLCNGYNIEQRDCNLFECKDAVNLLSLVNNTKTSTERLSAHINQLVGGNDFTIMLTIKSKVSKQNFPFEESSQHSVSLRSDNKKSSLTISIIENGMKVVQEKDSKSEMFAIKLNLFDLHWHQIAFSFRWDGLITCYIDCNWDSSVVVSKGAFEVPPYTKVEMNSKLNDVIEWKQLSLISGNHERSQCSNDRTPIYDNNKLLERMFDDETN